VATRVSGLTGATLQTAPSVCQSCVWWQSRSGREVEKDRWREKIEEEWGAWGTLYYDDDGRLLGSMQYGPSGLFPRAGELPAGPPSEDALLVTCAYLVDRSTPWVRDKGAHAVEAFGYRYREGSSIQDRFIVHRTIFPHDFLADFGFLVVRSQGPVELARLELGGLVPVLEGPRAKVLRILREVFSPQPVPAPRP